jgi:hypothetical protein
MLEAAADRMVGTWGRELIADMRSTAKLAYEQDAALSKVMPDLRAYLRDKSRAYDAYVTRDREPDAESCSCHINPPCGYCTRQGDDEEEA